jgi:hypothetical protein
MSARLPRRGPRRRAAALRVGARLWRLAAVLAALACALLASAAVVTEQITMSGSNYEAQTKRRNS